jgi:hypothetical protein
MDCAQVDSKDVLQIVCEMLGVDQVALEEVRTKHPPQTNCTRSEVLIGQGHDACNVRA